MIGLVWIAAIIAGVTAFAVILVVLFMREVDKHRAALDAEKKARADAELQATYADIATKQRDSDSTARVLDQGQFFVSPTKSVYHRGTDASSKGTEGES